MTIVKICPLCHGTGDSERTIPIHAEELNGISYVMYYPLKCERCGGSGIIRTKKEEAA